MSGQTIESFRSLVSLNLKTSCQSIGISHKYCVSVFVVSNQVHLLKIDDLIRGDLSKFVNLEITAQFCTCSEEKFAVVCNGIVSIHNFSDPKRPVAQINGKGEVTRVCFNPADSNMIAVLSDIGNLTLVKLTEKGQETFAMNDTKITAMCFSPKGKQLCVGHNDGNLSQFKLDLTVAKRFQGSGGIPLSILWISTTQFLVSFFNHGQFELVQIDLQKAPQPPLYINLGDPFVSDKVEEKSQTFMTLLHPNCIICSSSTSSDVVVLAKTSDKWQPEFCDDDRRADLPVDQYSIGHLFYFNQTEPLAVGATERYDPMPIYILASPEGIVRGCVAINKQGKGENAKYGTALTPLDLSLLSNTKTQQSSAADIANLGFLPSSGVPLTPVSTANPINFSKSAQPTFGTTPEGSAQNLVQPAPATGSGLFFGQKSTETPPIVKPAPILKTSDAVNKTGIKPMTEKKSISFEGDKDPNAVSQPLLRQFQELQLRFQKLKVAKFNWSEKLGKELPSFRKSLEAFVVNYQREEDLIRNLESTSKIQEKEINGLMEKTLSDLSQLDYLRTLEKEKKDPTYLQLLRLKSVDPSLLREFKTLEKTYTFLRTQIQECRRHFFYEKAPQIPTNSPLAAKYIKETLSTHSKVLHNLVNENNAIRERLGIQNPIDKLAENLLRSHLIDKEPKEPPKIPTPKNVATVGNVNSVKHFLRRKAIIRIQSLEEPSFVYKNEELSKKPESSLVVESSTEIEVFSPLPVAEKLISISPIPGKSLVNLVPASTFQKLGVSSTTSFISPTAMTESPKSASITPAVINVKPKTVSSTSGAAPQNSPILAAGGFLKLDARGAGAGAFERSNSPVSKTTSQPTLSWGTPITSELSSTPAFDFGATVKMQTQPAPSISTTTSETSSQSSGIKITSQAPKQVATVEVTKPTLVNSGNTESKKADTPVQVMTPGLAKTNTSTVTAGITKPITVIPSVGMTTKPAQSSAFQGFSFAKVTSGPTAVLGAGGECATYSFASQEAEAATPKLSTGKDSPATTKPLPSSASITAVSVAIATTTVPLVSDALADGAINTPVLPRTITKPVAFDFATLGSTGTEAVAETTTASTKVSGFLSTSFLPVTSVTAITTSEFTFASSTISPTPTTKAGIPTFSFASLGTTLQGSPITSETSTPSFLASTKPSSGVSVVAASVDPIVTTLPTPALSPFAFAGLGNAMASTISSSTGATPTISFTTPATTTTTSVGGTVNKTPITFSFTPQASNVASPATPAATGGSNSGSIFGGSTPTITSPSFGNIGFGTTTICSPSFMSGLGSPVPAKTEIKNVFGGGTSFGQNLTANIFGGGLAPVTNPINPPTPTYSFAQNTVPSTQSSVFGGSSAFGGAPTFGTAPVSSFGSNSVFGSTPLSSFGTTPTAATGSIFGGGATQSSIGFGQLAQQSSPSVGFGGGSVFGGSTSSTFASNTSNTGGTIFGGGSTTTPTVGFGQMASNPNSGFGNGNNTGNVFGGFSKFGSPSTVGTGTGSVFGGNATMSSGTGNIFCGNTTGGNVFGGTSGFGQPAFGHTPSPQPTNVFGAGSVGGTFGSASPFGGNTTSGFSSFSNPQPAPQQQQPAQPSFGGNSFSSWR